MSATPQDRPINANDDFAYIPSLDGVRAVAIILVLLGHIGIYEHPNGLLPGGLVGVDVFFVLSGFLITSQLVSQSLASGRIHLGRFYMRRAARILPAAGTCLLTVIAFSYLYARNYYSLIADSALHATFFMANWFAIARCGDLGPLTHFWSLSLEEQYYLVYPLLLSLILRKNTFSKVTVCSFITVGVASSIFRYSIFVNEPGQWCSLFRALLGSDSRITGLCFGSALGYLWQFNALPKFSKFRSCFTYILCLLVIPTLIFGHVTSSILYIGGLDIVILATCSVIWICLQLPHSQLCKILSSNWLRFIGKISYGLYLWHFVVLWSWHYFGYTTGFLNTLLVLIIICVITLLSYYIVERPIIRHVRQLTKV